MKIRISTYTFNAASKQITFTSYSTIKLESLLLITNTTSNTIIYNFADSTAGGTVSGNVLTLTYNTTSMNNTDALQIYYDDTNIAATDSTLQAIQTLAQTQADTIGLLKRIAEYTSNLDVTDSQQRLRVVLDNVGINSALTGSLNVNTWQSNNQPSLIQITDSNSRAVFSNVNAASLGIWDGTASPLFKIPDFWHNVDQARLSFARAIRTNLTFS